MEEIKSHPFCDATAKLKRELPKMRIGGSEGMTYKEAVETIKAHYPDERYTMLREALDIAINALKQEEPRLMKPEEVAKADDGTVVWVEKHTEERDYLSAMVCGGEGYIGNFYLSISVKDLESKNIRFWTSRPTDEQREAVKWDD